MLFRSELDRTFEARTNINAQVVADVHRTLDGLVRHSSSVGATHWDASRGGVTVPAPKPEFFFAPSQLVKRGKEWGRDVLYSRMDSALAVFTADARRWLRVSEGHGADTLLACYADHVTGGVDPSVGHVFSL